MIHNFVVAGVIFTPLVPQLLLAVILTLLLSFVLGRLGLFRIALHRPLVEACIFCIIVGVLVILASAGSATVALLDGWSWPGR